MTEIRVYPEKDLACIVTELGAVDSADNILWSSVNYDNKESDGEYVYIRMKLSELMHNLEVAVKAVPADEETLKDEEHS